jgi:hypothetical protein
MFVRLLDPRTGELLREHLGQKRGGHRIRDRDRPRRTPPHTHQLLARAHKAGTNIGAITAKPKAKELTRTLAHIVCESIEECLVAASSFSRAVRRPCRRQQYARSLPAVHTATVIPVTVTSAQ